jgi:H2-forming N5,N10-methylenetetrahydromethanopterin dehydrogenase-like enzyme
MPETCLQPFGEAYFRIVGTVRSHLGECVCVCVCVCAGVVCVHQTLPGIILDGPTPSY